MRKLAAVPALAVAALALTGCTPEIDKIDSSTPLEEKDRIYIEWVEDNYRDAFPDMRPAQAPEAVQSVCDLHYAGMGDMANMIYLEVPQDQRNDAKTMIDKGMEIYCPAVLGTDA